MAEVYREAKIYFRGEELGDVTDVSITHNDGATIPEAIPTGRTSGSYECAVEWHAPLRTEDRPEGFDLAMVFWMLTPNRRGTSDGDLLRRASYGGRKGRRALRRLVAKGRDRNDTIAAAMLVRLLRRSGVAVKADE